MRRLKRWLRDWCSARRKRKTIARYGWSGWPGPQDNPYRGSDTYSEMKWDQEHGYADYS